MSIYRQIYETYIGPIPKDPDGRTYEIHHIDGNIENNDISNLRCVSLKEHYNIHYAQGDYGACFYMAKRMKISASEKSILASLAALKRVEEGTHNLVGESNPTHKRIKDGTHHWQNSEKKFVQNQRRVEAGTHNFLGGEIGGYHCRKRIADGTHHFLVPHTCPHCGLEGNGPNMKRWHFDKCKHKLS